MDYFQRQRSKKHAQKNPKKHSVTTNSDHSKKKSSTIFLTSLKDHKIYHHSIKPFSLSSSISFSLNITTPS